MEKLGLIKMEKLEASGKQGKKPTKSKKPKEPASLTEDQLKKLPKLPKNWKWVSHSEIATINPPKPDGNELLEVSFLPMPTVEEETGRYSLSETRKFREVRKGYTGFIEGDVIFAKITPCMENGKVAYLEKLVNGVGFGSTEFHVSRPTPSVFGKYLFNYLVQQTFRKEAKRNMTGSAGQLRVPSSYFAEQPFPLAPLPEQRAIVSKIEQLFSELDNGISNLKLAQEQLKVYRQAVLKKAFEGELTKKWREQQTDLPDAGELLEQIHKEREEFAKIFGKKMKTVKSLTEAELAELYSLPEGWKWMKIGDFEEHIGSGATPKGGKNVYQNEGIIFIRSQNVYPEGLFLDDVAYISEEIDQKLSRSRINERDVLLNITGASIGRCTYIPVGFPRGNVNQHVCIIRPNHKIAYYKYLSAFLNSPFIQSKIGIENTGVTRQALTFEQIRKFPFPFCSLPEQHAIVQEIETRLSVCDKIEQDIKENLEKAEALRQSILKKAFEGKLLNERELAEVRGAEDWEPAEVLLERIKAEKAGNGKKEKLTTEKLKSIIQEDKGIMQQATLQAFEQIDK